MEIYNCCCEFLEFNSVGGCSILRAEVAFQQLGLHLFTSLEEIAPAALYQK